MILEQKPYRKEMSAAGNTDNFLSHSFFFQMVMFIKEPGIHKYNDILRSL